MDVTLFEMITDVRPVQLLNATPSITVTEFGNVMLKREVQFWNALRPIFCTPFPKFTDFRFEQLWNAPSPIASILSGIVIFSMPVQPASKLLTIVVVPVSNVTFLRVAQLTKGPVMLQLDVSQPVKDFGISMLVIAVPVKEP